MPLTYQEFVETRKKNPEEHPRNELLVEEGPQRTSTQESVLNWQ